MQVNMKVQIMKQIIFRSSNGSEDNTLDMEIIK